MIKRKGASSSLSIYVHNSFTSSDGYTLHVNQQQVKQHTNPASGDTHGYQKSNFCLS